MFGKPRWGRAVYSLGVTNVQADALSRIPKDAAHEKRFFLSYRGTFPGPSLPASVFSSYPSSELLWGLERTEALCVRVKKHLLNFAYNFGLESLPASKRTVCLYIAYHAKKFELSTVVNHVNSIASYHYLKELHAPDMNHFSAKRALAGVKRHRQESPFQREPIL